MSYITGDMITENPKHGTVIICGVPKNQDGTYYCPYCTFESEEIENFATSMCWDCALADDEEVSEEEKVMDLKDIRENDVVKVSMEAKVTVVGNTGFYDSTGRFHQVVDAHCTVELLKREPEGFPIQTGDIWLADDGKEWYVFAVNGGSIPIIRAITTPHNGDAESNLNIEEFKPKAVKLMHRRTA